jgi:hypothetical protein
MEIEQGYVIKFFIDEGMKSLDILIRLHKNYSPRAFSRSTLYFWIGETRGGRTDLSEIPGSGRTSDESLAIVIAKRHEQRPHLSARKLAQSLQISSTMVYHYLSDVLGLKCFRLSWVPHTLTVDQKAKRAQYAEAMLQILAAHESARFHFRYTGNESWLLYSYHERIRLIASWDDISVVEHPSHYHKKTILSVFFNGTGQFLINILPEDTKMDTDYFAENIIDEIARLCSPQGKRPRERRIMLHFDNAPIHCTDTVRDRMAAAELERMEYPPYSTDLVPCDFFLFGCVKGKLVRKQYETPEYRVSEMRNIIEGIHRDVLKSVFESWNGRLLNC